ncbi:hypothetical protein EAY27_21010 [Vibrio anguillarum]|uniref:Uncharacterized protein n=4 Tax=Vibrio anguillarum TaxID=55601 RepID=A0A7U6FPP7_VIBAN|nr:MULTISPECIES: integrase repeat-containing protein [Vibrio]ASW79755.1 hypothetical protein CK207_00640 [Vibrio anguillarum]AZS25063.1 hypothetical protein DYL72_08395 [Vibrio anguillarum]MBF4279576.1 hypothetical protein [Vibrio anguillarum]UXH27776.1 hypothetical protein N5E84_12270 [Vibrio sp. J502]
MSQRYKTLKEASDATIALFKSIGIRFPTVDLYKKNYKKDPMLPIDPRRYDDFTTWQAYAGKAEMVQKYSTIEEAIAANVVLFKKLGISTPTYELYKDNYKKDPRLPSDPRRYESFKTWNEYLGKGKPVEKYPTYKEAKAAAAALFKKLGINEPTVALYTEHYEKDPRLHADPREVFKKFRWINYLGKKEPIGKYKTLEEASTAIIALFEELGIEKPTRVLYRKHYKEDPKLPSAPEEYYSKFTTFAKFFGIEPIELYPTVKEASVAAISMFEELGITNPTSNDYVREYWNDPRLPSNPRRYYDDFISYSEFLGRGIVVDKYQTFEEAKVATDVIFKELGIIEPTRTQYAKYFKNDPKLPSNPFYTYHKPVDWPSYLGRKHFYSREVALVRAIKLLGSAEITEDEYRAICGLDERLPIQAVVYYGLNSWSEFVGLNVSVDLTPPTNISACSA